MCSHDEISLNPNSKHFNLKEFSERKNKLIYMTEIEASKLPHSDYYDRCRYLAEIAGEKMLKEIQYKKNKPALAAMAKRDDLWPKWEKVYA